MNLSSIATDVLIPILTLIGGWFAHLIRSKQKKESDILENVQQILQMQKDYIADQDAQNKKNCNMIARLEKKLDDKNRSIRQANKCKHTNEGDGCPVLGMEEKQEKCDLDCGNCKIKEEVEQDDNGEA